MQNSALEQLGLAEMRDFKIEGYCVVSTQRMMMRMMMMMVMMMMMMTVFLPAWTVILAVFADSPCAKRTCHQQNEPERAMFHRLACLARCA